MKFIFKLFLYDFKNIYKQTLIFAFISTFLFALSISVMCFSSDMVQGYRDWLDEDGSRYLGIYRVTDFDGFKELDGRCGYFTAQAYGITELIEDFDGDEYSGIITYAPMLQKGDKLAGYDANTYIFRDELPNDFLFTECHLISGEYLGKSLNDRTDGRYYVYISENVAKTLEAVAGDIVTLNYELSDGTHKEEFTVAGIYALNEDETLAYCRYDFALPFAFVFEHKDKIKTNENNPVVSGCNFELWFSKKSDIMDLLPYVRRINAGDIGEYEEIDLVNTMRYILITVAVAICAVTFAVLSNSLTITVNSRKQYMAKLKLLGATCDNITAMFFILLVLSFIAAFALSVLLSYFLCGYFSSVAAAALEYKVTMRLHWDAVGILFAVGCALLAVRYALFRRKVKKVAPAEFIKEN